MRVCGPGESSLAISKLLRAAASLALLAACIAGRAEEPQEAQAKSPGVLAALKPRAFFVQMGIAKEVTAGTAGVIWNLGEDGLNERWSVYVEGSVSRWQSRGGYATDHGVLTQLALIPVLRYRFGEGRDEGRSPWFVEGGIGATVTSSVYRDQDKHFSTAFNFGDHVGVGYAFGPAHRDEIVLRAEHFSNAGIKHPNPGENFLELRYVHHFD